MKCVIQRVRNARVEVEEETVGAITSGLLVYVGFDCQDDGSDIRMLASKLCRLRIFPDGNGKMNLSIQDVGDKLLIISQFTLVADLYKGNRPSWDTAAPPEKAKVFYENFLEACRHCGVEVEQGRFGAHMHVHYENDGPVTFILESKR